MGEDSEEIVRLLVSSLQEVEIVDGELSGTGQTISVEYEGERYRLDADEIIGGNSVWREHLSFRLYFPDIYAEHCRSLGREVPSDLPDPSHDVDYDRAEEFDIDFDF